MISAESNKLLESLLSLSETYNKEKGLNVKYTVEPRARQKICNVFDYVFEKKPKKLIFYDDCVTVSQTMFEHQVEQKINRELNPKYLKEIVKPELLKYGARMYADFVKNVYSTKVNGILGTVLDACHSYYYILVKDADIDINDDDLIRNLLIKSFSSKQNFQKTVNMFEKFVNSDSLEELANNAINLINEFGAGSPMIIEEKTVDYYTIEFEGDTMIIKNTDKFTEKQASLIEEAIINKGLDFKCRHCGLPGHYKVFRTETY